MDSGQVESGGKTFLGMRIKEGSRAWGGFGRASTGREWEAAKTKAISEIDSNAIKRQQGATEDF